MKAVGFDLGETLIHYKGIPLNWKALYKDALRFMAIGLDCVPTDSQIIEAESILSRYNTRLNPRTVEVTSNTIITQILKVWNIPSDKLIDIATLRFF